MEIHGWGLRGSGAVDDPYKVLQIRPEVLRIRPKMWCIHPQALWIHPKALRIRPKICWITCALLEYLTNFVVSLKVRIATKTKKNTNSLKQKRKSMKTLFRKKTCGAPSIMRKVSGIALPHCSPAQKVSLFFSYISAAKHKQTKSLF